MHSDSQEGQEESKAGWGTYGPPAYASEDHAQPPAVGSIAFVGLLVGAAVGVSVGELLRVAGEGSTFGSLAGSEVGLLVGVSVGVAV